MRYLTVALTKGRLANKTMEMFEKAGITCEEMKDKDSRKLIFTNEELKMKFFLAKGPDVPTYVEYGAADIGIVGKDTILEEGRKLYEVMDLGFGKCKMCVCGPESAREVLAFFKTSSEPNICGISMKAFTMLSLIFCSATNSSTPNEFFCEIRVRRRSSASGPSSASFKRDLK